MLPGSLFSTTITELDLTAQVKKMTRSLRDTHLTLFTATVKE